MRKVSWVVLFLCAFLFTGHAVQAQPKVAESLVELELIYPSSEVCRTCHLDIYKDWAESLHRGSVTAIVGELSAYIDGLEKDPAKKARLEAGGMKAEVMKCLSCHAPSMEVASDKMMQEVVGLIRDGAKKGSPASVGALKKLERLTVSCYSCHNLKALPTPVETDALVAYGPKAAAERSPFHEIKKGAFLVTSDFCGQCHGTSTTPDGEKLLCSTVTGSYQNEYAARGGKEGCQDCHMRREKRGHKSPGSNSADMLREGVGMTVSAAPVKGKRAADVSVELTNSAGHRVPGSWMWTTKLLLELTAKDQNGKVLWSASKEYFRPKDQKNQKGKQAKDSSLAPGKTTEKFRAALGKTAGKVELEVSLTYVHAKDSKKTLIRSAKQTLEL